MYTGIFLKTALRSFRRDKGYVLLNVTGLALGIACFLLIFLFVKDELSYDRFHEKSHRIYRVSVSGNLVLPPALGPALARRLPGVEQVVRLHRYGTYLVERGERQDYEEGVFAADSSFFEVFSFELIEGNPATALTRPGTVVISEHLASKYFGDERSLGQTLEIENLDFEVSGVLKDIPDNSHFHAHLLFPLVQEEAWQDLTSWDSWSYYTYLRVHFI